MENEDWKKDFSEEELVALGEKEASKEGEKPPETKPDDATKGPDDTQTPPKTDEKPPEGDDKTAQQNTEHTPAEEAAMKEMGLRVQDGFIIDDDGTKIPASRWKKLYFDYQERGRKIDLTEKKNDLLKRLGRDEYFKLYPDEAPAGYKPKPQPQQTDVLPIGDRRVLALKVTGGTYDGYTLKEVLEADPESGMAMYSQYVNRAVQTIQKRQEQEGRTKAEQEKAVSDFGASVAKELFNVEDPTKLTSEQMSQIHKIGKDVLDWQVLNGKLHLDWQDAYKLMTYEAKMGKAKTDAAANALKGLTKTPIIPSISGGNGAAKDTGWDAMAKWTADEMTKHIDGLNDKAYDKFLKEAPASIKAKFQNIPWL